MSLITGDSVPRGLSEEATAAWVAAKRSLLSATPVFRVGSEERGPGQFAYVSKADFAPNGNLVVLDEDAQEIRIFDSQGRFVEQFGGIGDGPMELRRARDFHLFPDGRIAVPLGDYGPIKIFERSETRWELSEMVDAHSRSLCGMEDGRWFSAAYASADGTTIINELGDSVRSFGSGYRYDKWYIRRALSGGSVACLDRSDRIVYGFEVLPLVHGYATDGFLQWTAAVLEDYLQLRVTESQGPGGTVAYSEGTLQDHDRLMSVFVVGDGDHVLLDYSRVLPDEKKIVQRHYLIDAATGAATFTHHTVEEKRMTKADLVEQVADAVGPRVVKMDCGLVVEALLEAVKESLARGDRIELRGFGTFKVRHRKARTARNPRTGEPVAVPPRAVPSFKPSRDLRRRVDRGPGLSVPGKCTEAGGKP